MRITNLTRRRGAKSTALLSAAVLAASAIVATMGAASAGVTVGPDRTPMGFRTTSWTAEGLAVAPCDTNTGVCGGAFDPADPAYWDAGGDAGPIRAGLLGQLARGRAGSPASPGPGPDVRVDYTIKDPWGTVTCQRPRAARMDCRLRRAADHHPAASRPSAPDRRGFVGHPERDSDLHRLAHRLQPRRDHRAGWLPGEHRPSRDQRQKLRPTPRCPRSTSARWSWATAGRLTAVSRDHPLLELRHRRGPTHRSQGRPEPRAPSRCVTPARRRLPARRATSW